MACVCVQAQARELEAELCAFADPAGAGPQRFCHHVLAALSKRTGTIFPHSLLDLPSSSPFLGNVSVPEGSDEQRQLVQVRPQHKKNCIVSPVGVILHLCMRPCVSDRIGDP